MIGQDKVYRCVSFELMAECIKQGNEGEYVTEWMLNRECLSADVQCRWPGLSQADEGGWPVPICG